MGNSPDHFIGPETPRVPANSNDSSGQFKPFRDSNGKILRQGAQFRVFEYAEDSNGTPSSPREVTVGGDVVDIEWRVHLANRKASFYVFDGQNGAEDLYMARSQLPADRQIKTDPDRTNLRNAHVSGNARANDLDIDPGEQVISSRRSSPVELKNTKTKIPIESLGTLLIGEKGRLIVLGGYGQSNSTEDPPRQIDEYASNDTWFDDASDGPVKARLYFGDGSFIDADPAWLLVGPPKFSPGFGNVVSLYDTLWDIAVREIDIFPSTPSTPMLQLLREQKTVWLANGGKSLAGFKPSFVRDVYPLIKRALGVRDVHVSGIQNPNYHLVSLGNWTKLSASGPDAAEGAKMRKYVFDKIRDPDATEVAWDKMPRGLGDDYTSLDDGAPTPQSFLSLTRIQYAILREWTAGSFVSDWTGSEPTFSAKTDPTSADLDFAATQNCVGGPFYPGIEVSWLIRAKDLYSEPFRLNFSRKPESEETVAPLKLGALEFRPGFFSQQMALPWQADFYDCHKERFDDPNCNEFYFMWWTAQRPDDVFPSGGTTQKRWVREFDKGADTDNPDGEVRR